MSFSTIAAMSTDNATNPHPAAGYENLGLPISSPFEAMEERNPLIVDDLPNQGPADRGTDPVRISVDCSTCSPPLFPFRSSTLIYSHVRDIVFSTCLCYLSHRLQH